MSENLTARFFLEKDCCCKDTQRTKKCLRIPISCDPDKADYTWADHKLEILEHAGRASGSHYPLTYANLTTMFPNWVKINQRF